MNNETLFHRNSEHIGSYAAPFRLFGGLFSALQAHSSHKPLKNSFSGHPQVAQGKQCYQLLRALGQPFVAYLGETKLALDNSEGMFHLGPDVGLELFCLVQQVTPGRVLIRCPAFARAHGHLPTHTSGFLSFLGPLVASIGKHYSLIAMQQGVAFGHVVDISRYANDGVHQARVGIDPNVGFHAEVLGYAGGFEHDLGKPVGMARKLVSVELQTNWGWSARHELRDGIEKTYNYYLKECQQ